MKKDNRKRIGIMGGTFNPIHVGHLMLAEWAREAALLDEVWFIPTGYSYTKQDKEYILDGEERLRMVQLATQDQKAFICMDTEVRRDGYTYTYQTIDLLNKEHPGVDLYFIMGADCLFSIDSWIKPDRIFKGCTILAAARNGSSYDKMKEKCIELEQRFGGRILLMEFLAMELSSSQIRERIKEGSSIRYLVPESVRSYIEKNHFYQC